MKLLKIKIYIEVDVCMYEIQRQYFAFSGNLIIFNVESWLNDELQTITHWMIIIEFAAY